MLSRRSAVFFAVAVAIALIVATPTFAAKGGIPGPPDKGGESAAVNNLSFPLLTTGGNPAIPGSSQGESSLGGVFYYWDGINPPCDPSESTCSPDAPYRVYIQKDPDNIWQAEWDQPSSLPMVEYIDVADNLESVPWRTTSVVRIEFVPFAGTALRGFEMVHVSGQGVDEVWGAAAPNAPNPTAPLIDVDYATLFDDTMALSLTKLEPDSGSIEVEPDPTGLAYTWDEAAKVWVRANTTAVAQTIKIDFTAEINVKGRVIYGHNWMLKRTAMTPGVTKDGWWRLTFYAEDPSAALDFTPLTEKYDPIAGPPTEEEIVAAAEESEGSNPNYPREPVVLPEQDLVYIDIYIVASNAGGQGGGGNQGGGNGNKP